MMARRAAWAAVPAAALAVWLLLGASPALAASASPAAGTRPSAGTPAGASATLLIRTVPRVRGVRVLVDGRLYRTGPRGLVAIPTTSGRHHIHILRPRSHPADTTVRFSRWLDGIALADRTIVLSPGTNVEQAGFVVSHPIAVRFADSHGQPVTLGNISRVTIDSSLGERYTFSPGRPPRSLAVNRIVRDPAGLVPLAIRYSVRDVVFDGANVVHGGSQNFFVRRSGAWTVKLLLFPLQVKVQDALFGFAIGSAVRLTLPDGSSRTITLRAGHSVTLARLPRATYQLVAKGPGFGLASPSNLSKPQIAQLQLLSWVDILVAASFAMLFLVGLPVLGGRIVRRQGRIGLPVWHVGRSLEPAFAPGPGPGAAVGGPAEALAPGSVSEKPAGIASQPAPAAPAPAAPAPVAPARQAAGEDTAASEEADKAPVTEALPATTDTPQTAGTGRPAGLCPPAADDVSSARKASGTPATAGSAASSADPRAGGDKSSASVPTADGRPPYSRPVSPWVTRTTWPTWKGGRQ